VEAGRNGCGGGGEWRSGCVEVGVCGGRGVWRSGCGGEVLDGGAGVLGSEPVASGEPGAESGAGRFFQRKGCELRQRCERLRLPLQSTVSPACADHDTSATSRAGRRRCRGMVAAPGIPPRAYTEDRCQITFWRHRPARGRLASPAAVAAALHTLHAALAALRPADGRTPRSIRDDLVLGRHVLAEPHFDAMLRAGDRGVPTECIDHELRRLAARATRHVFCTARRTTRTCSRSTGSRCSSPSRPSRSARLTAYPQPHDARMLAICRTLV
jgi:hypothetical protein